MILNSGEDFGKRLHMRSKGRVKEMIRGKGKDNLLYRQSDKMII